MAGRGQLDDHFVEAEQVAQIVGGANVGWIADGDGQHLVLEGQRQHLVDRRHRFRNERQHFGRRLDLGEIDDLQIVLFGQRLEELLLGDEALLDGGLAGEDALVLRFVEDLPELLRRR